MNRTTTIRAALLTAATLTLLAMPATARDFDPAAYESEAAIAKGAKQILQKANLKRIRAQDVGTVAITEFKIEYITQKKQMTNAGGRLKSGKFSLGALAVKGAEMAGVGETTIEIDDETKQTLPTELYRALVTQLQGEGFEVMTLEQVATSEAYERYKTRDEGKTKREGRGMWGGGKKQKKVQTFSADGLGVMKAGVISGIKNSRTEAKLMSDMGADMTLRVHLRVGVYNKGKPSIEPETTIHIAAGVNQQEKLGGGTLYSLKQMGSVSAKKPLVYQVDVLQDKEWEVGKGKVLKIDGERFDTAMHEMFPAFTRMVASVLK